MATMYPAAMQRESAEKSAAEVRVFEYLRDKTPSSWHVIHSFRIPHHNKVLFGECDFIVIAPHHGIAFLEVKGGSVGIQQDGQWRFTNRYGVSDTKPRGPFEQAREGMFEIEKIICDLVDPKFASKYYNYTYGVIFVDERNFPIHRIPEDENWRLIQNNVERDYYTFIKKLCNNQKIETKEVFHSSEKFDLSEEDASRIAKGLRPSIECIRPVRSYIDYSEEDIIKLTEEQLDCLDDIELNPHIVVIGGAGTGKTQIALQDARIAAQNKQRVAVICYNSLLKRVIEENLRGSNAEVYTLHGLMTSITGIKSPQNDSLKERKDFFESILPDKAKSVLKEKGPKYDKIIVDEFQDICKKIYLDFLDALLEGGLSDGRFSFYGDFSHQAIYDNDVSMNLLDGYAFYSIKKLSINCRNTKYIGNEMINISGFNDRSYRLKITGEPVDYIVYKDSEDEKKKFAECIKSIRANNELAKDILVLSPKQRVKSIVGQVDPNSLFFPDYGGDLKGSMAYFSTVHAFKGLDSKIVVLVDVTDYADSQLMYVALSRARSKLYVLESKDAYKRRISMLSGRT